MDTNNNNKEYKYDKLGYRIEDLSVYKPKKYYIEPENEEKLEIALQRQEDFLKQFKYHEEIPRMSQMDLKPYMWFNQYELNFVASCIIGFSFYLVGFKQYYGVYFSRYRRKKFILGSISGCMALCILGFSFKAKSQPQHWGIYTPFFYEKKMQNLLDYKFDLYQNVDQIKYHDKHPSKKEIYELDRTLNDKMMAERLKIWKELGL